MTSFFVVSLFFWWVVLYSCLTGCLAWDIQHWSLQAVGYSWVLMLRWGPPGGHTPIDIPWHLRFSVSLAVWTQSSHHRSSGPTSGLGTKILQACGRRSHGPPKTRTSKSLEPLGWGAVMGTWSHRRGRVVAWATQGGLVSSGSEPGHIRRPRRPAHQGLCLGLTGVCTPDSRPSPRFTSVTPVLRLRPQIYISKAAILNLLRVKSYWKYSS